jgi:hypothetical protein
VLLQIVVKIEEADAGFNQNGAVFSIDLNLLHSAEIEHNRALHHRSRTTIAEILTATDRPERDLILVGDAHDRAHFFNVCGGECSPGLMLAFIACKMIRIGNAIIIACHHMVFADCGSEGAEGSRVECHAA